jgi:hypothetical protein
MALLLPTFQKWQKRLLVMGWLCMSCLAMVTAAEETVLHSIAATPLAITLPTTWQVEQNQLGTVLVARSPLPITLTGEEAERGRGVISVVVQAVKNEGPFAFSMRCRRDLERTVMGLILEKSADVVLGGRNWTKQAYQLQVGQFTFRQELFTTVVDDHGVCLTCSSEASAYNVWSEPFALVIKSLAQSRLQIDTNP